MPRFVQRILRLKDAHSLYSFFIPLADSEPAGGLSLPTLPIVRSRLRLSSWGTLADSYRLAS